MNRHRNTSTILSFLGSGLGQLYNRQWIKGSVLLIIHAVGLTYLIKTLYHAIWGIVTLGEHSAHFVKVGKIFKHVAGDHSIFLLINGLITIFIFILFVVIYISNIRDAYLTGKAIDAGERSKSFKQTLHFILDKQFPYFVLSLPGIGILFFTILPIFFMVLLAFTNFNINHLPPAKLVDWVGFATFKALLILKTWSHTFYGVLAWTIVWAILATVTTYFGGILVAVLIQQKGIRFKAVWRTLFIIPWAIPQLVSLLIMRNLLNGQFGPINMYLSYFGLGKLPWLTDPFWAKATVILVNMWIGIPVSMVLVMGILTTIPRDMYEAAEMDGATNFQKFRVVTMPMILYATAPILIMQFAGNINNFNVIYLLTEGGPTNGNYQFAGSTDLLVTWLYKLTLNNNEYNFASAIGIIIFLILASVSIWSYRRSKSFKEEDMIQ